MIKYYDKYIYTYDKGVLREKMRLSACTIAKNEEENIVKSINSYKDYVDEIIVVDTGSTDRTVELAEKAGAKVLHFEWIGDFSAAKNFALDHATGDWIIFLDADEWFEGDCAKQIKRAISETEQEGFFAIACKLVNLADENEILERGCTTRIFKKQENIRFQRAIHETLFDLNKDVALASLYRDYLTVMHSGYMRRVLAKKAARNKALLEKNYALGNFSGIDYFYALRENFKTNPSVANHFYKMISMIEDYDEQIKSYNIGNNLYEAKMKLLLALPNEYSTEDCRKVLEEAKEANADNPTFYFYEYALLANIDYAKAIKGLEKAIELDKDFDKNNPAKSNTFYARKGEVYCILGEDRLLHNDKIGALNYFTESVKNDPLHYDTLKGLLYIMSSEKPDDIVIFLNSIYDINNKEVLRFLVDSLRLTAFHDIFLYYFVKWHKMYDEIDHSFFTSRMITNNFEEITDTYMKAYNESKDSKALIYVSAALICGNLKEKYEELSKYIAPLFTKILSAYFNGEKLSSITEQDFAIFINIFQEISYIAEEGTIQKLLNVYRESGEKALKEVIRYYYSNYSYDRALYWCEFSTEDKKSDDFTAYRNFVLANVYYRINDFDKLPETLENVIASGFLSQYIVTLCEILEADDEKLEEYKERVKEFLEIQRLLLADDFEDLPAENKKETTVSFEESLKDRKISLIPQNAEVFYRFAEKAFQLKKYHYAEKYYRLLIKYDYNKAESYYRLGMIYNFFGNADLSFYCYEKAFEENLFLASKLLPEENSNARYVYGKRKEEYREKCPICGEKGVPDCTYTNLQDAELSYNDSFIVKYLKCPKCDHTFAYNFMTEKIYPEKQVKRELDDKEIKSAYDVFEEISESKISVLILEKENTAFEAVARALGHEVTKGNMTESLSNDHKYDMIYLSNVLEKQEDILRQLNLLKTHLTEKGILLLNLYDKNSVFSTNKEIPLWTKSGMKNIFSRDSIMTFLTQQGYRIEKIKADLFNEGKMIVLAKVK
ncbi:MAG: glycosyltransferase [Clostridia bacterium]|nr:glycosyltransferase [Clostridia bacterium]